ncbi:hypothetical protein MRB53_018520 [Persea americana]|uniref:Uncharacterized protein n=1 Tax=Persea americana TaxID=3435 RepID=A0ACC2M928_PERAE|nr:hypothetical protein MRB53_018520 [Persea americana]
MKKSRCYVIKKRFQVITKNEKRRGFRYLANGSIKEILYKQSFKLKELLALSVLSSLFMSSEDWPPEVTWR